MSIVSCLQTTTTVSWRKSNGGRVSKTPEVLQMAGDMDFGDGGSGLVAENSTVLLIVGFVLGVVTVAVIVGLVQYYYCTRKSNALRTVGYHSEWGGTGRWVTLLSGFYLYL